MALGALSLILQTQIERRVVENVKATANTLAENLITSVKAAWSWLVQQGPEQALTLAIFFGLFIGLRIMRGILCGLLRSKKRPDYAVRNVASGLIGRTSSLFLALLSAVIIAPFVPSLTAPSKSALDTAFMIMFVAQGAIWVRTLIARTSSGYLSDHDARDGGAVLTAATLIKTLSGFIIWAIAIALILTNLGYSIGPIIAGLGVGGLAIGLAAQNLFKDLFSSLAIIFDRPFVRGDFIKFNNGEYTGDVEKIGMKTTRVRALTGEQIIVSNSQLLDKEIRNFRRMNRRRGEFDVGVVYQTAHDDLRRLPKLVEEAISKVEDVTFDRCRLKEFGDSSIVFETVFWVEKRDYDAFMEKQEAVLFNTHQAFEDAGLEFAYPTRTLHVASNQMAIA